MSPTGRGNTSNMVLKVSHTGPSATAANAGRDSAPSVTCWTGHMASSVATVACRAGAALRTWLCLPRRSLSSAEVSRSPRGGVDAALGPLLAPALMKLAGPAREGGSGSSVAVSPSVQVPAARDRMEG